MYDKSCNIFPDEGAVGQVCSEPSQISAISAGSGAVFDRRRNGYRSQNYETKRRYDRLEFKAFGGGYGIVSGTSEFFGNGIRSIAMSYFPMFIELNGRRCLVVGGGGIALHKIRVLKEFGADVLVVSPTVLPEILELKGVSYRRKSFDRSDLAGQELVVAATDDAEQNRRISELCREKHIPVNAVDQIKDCSFIFPAYLKEGEVVAAFSSI